MPRPGPFTRIKIIFVANSQSEGNCKSYSSRAAFFRATMNCVINNFYSGARAKLSDEEDEEK